MQTSTMYEGIGFPGDVLSLEEFEQDAKSELAREVWTIKAVLLELLHAMNFSSADSEDYGRWKPATNGEITKPCHGFMILEI